jgi:hypothetical protein
MGCRESQILDFEPNELCGQGPEVLEIAQFLDLSPNHLGVLQLAFLEIDTDASGFIQVDELASFLSIPHNSFADKCIETFDQDSMGVMCFLEFVVFYYVFASTSPSRYPELFFFLNFPKRHFTASTKQIIESFEVMYNKKIRKTPAASCIDDFEMKEKVTPVIYNVEKFVQLCKTRKAVMENLGVIVRRLQTHVFGHHWWEERVESREVDISKNTVEFLYTIRDKVTSINVQINKGKRMQQWKDRVTRMKAKRHADKGHNTRKQSVLLAFFSEDTGLNVTASKAAEDYHYADASKVRSSADRGRPARRRQSIIRKNLNYSEGPNGEGVVGGIRTTKGNKKITRGGMTTDRTRKR